jgi:hypothetical protein
MADTDGTRDGSAGGRNRPVWPSLRGDGSGAPAGDAPTGAAPDASGPTPGSARPAWHPAAAPPAAGAPPVADDGPVPTRRQIRTGAIPVVPRPAAAGPDRAVPARAGDAGAASWSTAATAAAAASGDAPTPTRRQIRTGAVPLVPRPGAGTADGAPGAGAPVPGGPGSAPGATGTAPAGTAPGGTAPGGTPAASSGAAGPRSTWTHPALVGHSGGDAAGPGSGVAAAEVSPGATPAPADPAPEGTDDAPRTRRRWPLVAGVVAAVLVLGGAVTAWVLTRDDAGTAGDPPAVVAPSPTATVAPVARAASSPFATALPGTLLQYGLVESAEDPDWLALGAVEALAETYSDGGTGQVRVQAGQWETPEEADTVLTSLVAAMPASPAAAADAADAADPAQDTADGAAAGGPSRVLLADEVQVDGAAVGTVTVVDAGDGSGIAVWRNGTTVVRVTGPADDIRNLYAAYPI